MKKKNVSDIKILMMRWHGEKEREFCEFHKESSSRVLNYLSKIITILSSIAQLPGIRYILVDNLKNKNIIKNNQNQSTERKKH
jgi:hypothetical protein